MSEDLKDTRNDALRNYPLQALGDAVLMELVKGQIVNPGMVMIVIDGDGNVSSTTSLEQESLIRLLEDIAVQHKAGSVTVEDRETVQ